MHLFLAECRSVCAWVIVRLVCVHDCVFAEYPCVHMDVWTCECVSVCTHSCVLGRVCRSVCAHVCAPLSVCVCVCIPVCALECVQQCLHKCVPTNVGTCESVRLRAHIAVCCG